MNYQNKSLSYPISSTELTSAQSEKSHVPTMEILEPSSEGLIFFYEASRLPYLSWLGKIGVSLKFQHVMKMMMNGDMELRKEIWVSARDFWLDTSSKDRL